MLDGRLLAGLGLAALLVAIAPLYSRSIWHDEASLLANFPQPGWRWLIEPLPFYSQAGSLLHNLWLDLLSWLPPDRVRMLSAALILPALTLSLGGVHRDPKVAGLTVLGLLALFEIPLFATELKHYGFEMLGTAVILGWFVGRGPDRRFGLADLAVLTLGLWLGIATMVIGALALGLWQIGRWHHQRRLALRDLGLPAVFAVMLAVFYVVITRVTEVQLRHPAYEIEGLDAVSRLGRVMLNLLLPLGQERLPLAAPLVGLAGLGLLLGRHDARARRFMTLSVLTVAAFAVLGFVGKYPATTPRHVTWVLGFLLGGIVVTARLLSDTAPGWAGGCCSAPP